MKFIRQNWASLTVLATPFYLVGSGLALLTGAVEQPVWSIPMALAGAPLVWGWWASARADLRHHSRQPASR